LELLKRASVCITHAGLNTVLEALAHGVPQVAIPITVDQPGVAARIAEKKTGLVVSLKELTPTRLSLVLDQVLNDSTYRDKVRYFQKVIAETNGLSKAANLLERFARPSFDLPPDLVAGQRSNEPRNIFLGQVALRWTCYHRRSRSPRRRIVIFGFQDATPPG